MFEIFNTLRERTADYQSFARPVPLDPQFQKTFNRVAFINVLVFFFPLVVIVYHFNYGSPAWLPISEVMLGALAIGIQVFIYWRLRLRPLPQIDNGDSLAALGLFEDIAHIIQIKVRRAWILSIASILPLVTLFAGPASIIIASRALYLTAVFELDDQLWRSALRARRLAVWSLVIWAVIATLLPLLAYIYLKRQAFI